MPLTYVVDPRLKLVTVSGDYGDIADWTRLLDEIVNDETIGLGFSYLRDLRGATNPATPATVVAIIDVVRLLWPKKQPSRAAILTSRDVDTSALVAAALADAQQLPLRIFRNYDEAIAWLIEITSPPVSTTKFAGCLPSIVPRTVASRFNQSGSSKSAGSSLRLRPKVIEYAL